MADQTTTIPPKGLGKIGWNDLLKGLIKATSGLIVGLAIKTLQAKQFPSYAEIEPFLEAVIYYFVGYLGINAATNNVGQMFTKDKPTVEVGAQQLQDIVEKADSKDSVTPKI